MGKKLPLYELHVAGTAVSELSNAVQAEVNSTDVTIEAVCIQHRDTGSSPNVICRNRSMQSLMRPTAVLLGLAWLLPFKNAGRSCCQLFRW